MAVFVQYDEASTSSPLLSSTHAASWLCIHAPHLSLQPHGSISLYSCSSTYHTTPVTTSACLMPTFSSVILLARTYSKSDYYQSSGITRTRLKLKSDVR